MLFPAAYDRDPKKRLRELALEAGFVKARFLGISKECPNVSPFEIENAVGTERWEGAEALLVAALPYGNQNVTLSPEPGIVEIAPFARFNYYREAVKRMQSLSREFRALYGGRQRDYRILCNSPVPEKPLAVSCGLGSRGRNGLVLTAEAGSLFVIAALTLPFAVQSDEAEPDFRLCADCAACVNACPTSALRGDGTLDLRRCIQWYASGNDWNGNGPLSAIPPNVATVWGRRFYGCTTCQDVCPHNARPIAGIPAVEGPLPAHLDAAKLLSACDEELRALFKHTALGMRWLHPAVLRRSAALAVRQ